MRNLTVVYAPFKVPKMTRLGYAILDFVIDGRHQHNVE